MKTYAILFAGAVGSSKTTIADYLSQNLDLVVLNNDAIRAETTASLGKFDEEVYEKLRNHKLQSLLERNISFIYDASIDRRWLELRAKLNENNYDYFVISLNFSRPLIEKLLLARGSDSSTVDEYLLDHDNFLKQFGSEISLNLNDKDFDSRFQISLLAVKDWLKYKV